MNALLITPAKSKQISEPYFQNSRNRKRKRTAEEYELQHKIEQISMKIISLFNGKKEEAGGYGCIQLLNRLKAKIEILQEQLEGFKIKATEKVKRRRLETWNPSLSLIERKKLVEKESEFISCDFKEIVEDETEWEVYSNQMQVTYQIFEEMALSNQLDRIKAKRIGVAARKRLPSKLVTVSFLLPPDHIFEIERCRLFAANIPFFKSLIMGGFKEGIQDEPIKLENVSVPVFQHILEYVKKGNIIDLISYDEQHIVDLINAANMYQMVNLVCFADRTLAKKVKNNNVYNLFKFSFEMGKNYQILLPQLFFKCLDVMKRLGLNCVVKNYFTSSDQEKKLLKFLKASQIEFQITSFFFQNYRYFEDFCHIEGIDNIHLDLDEAGSSVVSHNNFLELLKIFSTIHKITIPITKGASIRHWELLKKFSNLKHVDLNLDYVKYDYQTLFNALEKSSLPKVVKEQNYQVTILGLNQWSELSFQNFKSFSNLFETWDPLSRPLSFNLRQINDKELKKLLKCKRETDALDLSGFNEITDEGLKATIDCHPNLTRLDLSKSKRITDETLIEISKKLPHLKQLRLEYAHGFTENGLITLFRNCADLEVLSLNQCSGVTNSVIRQIGDTCKKLRNINLSRTFTHFAFLKDIQPSNITDESICYFVQECKNLEVLNLTGQTSITNKSLEAIAQHSLEMKNLKLWGCINLNGESISNLVKLQKLKQLDINYIIDIQPKDILLVVEKLKFLENLDFMKPLFSSKASMENRVFLIKMAYEQDMPESLISKLRRIM